MKTIKSVLPKAGMIFLTESSKSPASIARSNKQWVGLACIRRGTSPPDKLRSSYSVMSK